MSLNARGFGGVLCVKILTISFGIEIRWGKEGLQSCDILSGDYARRSCASTPTIRMSLGVFTFTNVDISTWKLHKFNQFGDF
jgi:hypothetical protein